MNSTPDVFGENAQGVQGGIDGKSFGGPFLVKWQES